MRKAVVVDTTTGIVCQLQGKDGHGGGRGQGGAPSGIVCQLYGKDGHTIIRCYKRFDASFTGPPHKSVSLATTSYGVRTNWYMDSEATDHVTGDLNNILHVPKACKSLLSINHLT